MVPGALHGRTVLGPHAGCGGGGGWQEGAILVRGCGPSVREVQRGAPEGGCGVARAPIQAPWVR